MSSFLQAVFGGGTSTQQSSSTSTPGDQTPAQFTALRQPVSNALTNWASTGGPQFTGPIQPTTSANQDTTLNQLQTMTGPNTARSGLLNDEVAGKYLPGQPGSNPFLSAAITAAQRPTLEGLTQTLTKDLPGRFTANGQFIQPNDQGNGGSSAFDNAAALATRGAANAIGDIATNMSNTQYDAERANQNQAVQLSQQEVQQSVSNLQAQSLPMMIQQYGIDNALQLFQSNTQNLLSILQEMGGLASPTIANSSNSQGNGQTVQYSGIVPAFKPAAGGSTGAAPAA